MPQRTPVPPVDYTSKDWATFRDDMEAAITTRLPEWTSRSPNDFGMVLIELFAYVGDALSFYGDRIANEAFLPTAVLRSSVLAIAKMLDYRPTQNLAAVTNVTFQIRSGQGAVTIPAGTQVTTVPVADEDPIVFETDAELVVADATPWSNMVSATQGRTVSGEMVGLSTGGLDQIFQLFYSPVIEGSEDIFVNEGSGATSWLYVTNLIDAGSDDAVYSTYTDENGVLNILFGDNVNGRAPANNATITATYRVGGGAIGNIGSNKLTAMVDPISNVIGLGNDAAQGGADAESLDEIRENAPRSLTTIDRAVTLDDYSNLARKVKGVAKAKAQAQVYTNVNLYIAPSGGGSASVNLKTNVLNYLAGRQMINATVTIYTPHNADTGTGGDYVGYIPINVSADVNVLPQYNRETVRLDVEKAVKEVLSYDNSFFGDRVTISEMYRAINGVTGVDYAVVSVLSRTPTGLADVQLADNEIPSIGTVTITATGGITTV